MPADPVVPPTSASASNAGQLARRIGLVLVLAAVVLLLYRLATGHTFFDLKIYMRAMHWWAAGNPLYDYVQADRVQGELYFTYPPFTALLLRPFAALKIGATAGIFTVATLATVILTTWWLVGPLADRHRLPRWFAVGAAVPLVLAVESVHETISFGQINMLLVALILADLLFAVPRKSRWAGVGVGLATTIKLFPGIFIVYLVVAGRWRAALTAGATAAGATLLAAAVAPGDSWRFWTQELWATERVGRPDYTGNQSLLGLLSRLTAPERPSQLLWLVLAVLIAGYGLHRARRAARAGDELAGLTLAGLVGVLISPITWTHHAYWFIPAVVVLCGAGWPGPGRISGPGDRPAGPGRAVPDETRAAVDRRRRWRVLTVVTYGCVVYGVVSYHDWGVAPTPTDTPVEFLFRNTYVLLAVLLLIVLPISGRPGHTVPGSQSDGGPTAPTPSPADVRPH